MDIVVSIIDTGHGSNTPGKRSIFHHRPDGKVVLKENSFNEAVGNKLSLIFHQKWQEYYFITNEWDDTPLEVRCEREREIQKKLEKRGCKSVFISIHADAFGENKAQGERASGSTFFYRSEAGKKVAEHMTQVFRDSKYPIKMREPKYANFRVLRETNSPAVLWEAGFMTNTSDLDELMKDVTRNIAAETLYKGISTLTL